MNRRVTPHHLFALGLMVLFAALAVWRIYALSSPQHLLSLKDWQYRWNPAEKWQPYVPGESPARGHHIEIWLKARIPAAAKQGQALFIPSYTAVQSFQVFLGGSLLYASGNIPAGFSDRHRYHLWHLIDLPPDNDDDILTFHFSSDHYRNIGLVRSIWMGTPYEILKHFIHTHFLLAVIDVLLLLTGATVLASAPFFSASSRKQLFAFAQLTIGAGGYLFMESDACQTVVTNAVAASYIHYFFLFLLVVGVARCMTFMVEDPYKSRLRWLARIFIIYPLAASLLDIFGILSWNVSFSIALFLFMILAVVLGVTICLPGFKAASNWDKALIRAAFLPSFLAVVLDAVIGIPLRGAGPALHPWGLLVMIGVLFYRLLVRDQEERLTTERRIEKAKHEEEMAVAEERRRMAHEIHDGVAQDLALMNLRASVWKQLMGMDQEKMVEEIAWFRDLLRKNLGEVRRSIFALRPVELEDRGFAEALAQQVREFEHYHPLRAALEMENGNVVPGHLEQEILRIIHECLNNIAKHSRGTAATISIANEEPGRLSVTIADDGVGFDPQMLKTTPRFGLRQIKERVEKRGGVFRIHTLPGQGTSVSIVFPT